MALLTVQRISKVGTADLVAALTAADAAGDTVTAASGLIIVVDHATGGGSHTLTVAAPVATVDNPRYGDLPVAALTLTVASGDTGVLTVPPGYANASGLFAWTYDAVTDVTVGVFAIAP